MLKAVASQANYDDENVKLWKLLHSILKRIIIKSIHFISFHVYKFKDESFVEIQSDLQPAL